MRQLRPGLGEASTLFSYLLAFLWLFSTVSATDPLKTGTPSIEKSELANSQDQLSSKEVSTEPRKEVAILRRDLDYGYGRRKGIVNNYVGQAQRSLNDYEPTEFVLLTTVAGTLSSRDRRSGKERWQIHTDDGAVETINHRANSSSEDTMQWIVEPSEDGQLLFYTPENGLESVGLTVKDIIHQTPYMPPGVDMVYNGAKNTTTYAINARTGVIQRVFSTGGISGVVNDKKCKTTTKLQELDDECDSTEGSDKIIMLGRTEYTIRIQRWSTAETLWTIRFNEWSPNNSDQDLRAQYQRPLDNRYIYSQHDGTIFGFDDAESSGMKPPRYHATLDSPVVRIFDVVRSLSKPDSDDLLVLPQPPMRSKMDSESSSQLDNTFVGITPNGGWYALSEANFPYVTRQASNAGCYEKAGPWKSLPAPEREKALVGIHKMHYTGPEPIRASLPAPAAYEDASGGRSNSNESPPASSPSLPGIPIVGTATTSTGYFMPGTIFLAILWFLTIAKIAHHQFDLPFSRSAIASKFFNSSPSGPVTPLLATEPAKPTTTVTSVETLDPPVLLPVEESPEEKQPEVQAPPDKGSGDQKLEEPKPEEPELGEAKDLAVVMPAVRFQEPEPAKESTPGVGEENGETATPPTTPAKKKKYQRGRRGGKKKSNGGDNGNTSANGSSTIEKLENAGPVTATKPGRIKIALEDGSEMEIRPPLVLNNLTIYEDVLLGSGSQGTTVHRGDWEGKLVAVKRILTTHADIAMKEVKTLQDADYHENVVRYYCQQVHEQFVYIALEICPGSLYDIIDKPQRFPDLVEKMNPRETLMQITKGLHHLHSLKIVHRDVKPQNILVGAPNFRSTHPRLLISDFGLCKKLQADEYSFGATTAQGAGTVGWRAPELLDKTAGEPSDKENSGSGTGTGSDVAVEDPITKRRATRAIDIFALGCVFYFVLSRGDHPFGQRYEREFNIICSKSTEHRLAEMYDAGLEAVDLVAGMIRQDPKKRPDTKKVGAHPFFWDAEKRLEFITTVSDRFENEKERMKANPGLVSPSVLILQRGEREVIGSNWLERLDPHLYADLTEKKRRGYDGTRIIDLLRVIRNKRNHFLDMSIAAQRAVGETSESFLQYFASRFDKLLMYTYMVTIETGFYTEARFKKFIEPQWQ